jgi:hypothetical protein
LTRNTIGGIFIGRVIIPHKEHMPPTETTALGHKIKKTRKAPNKVWSTARSLKPGVWLSHVCSLPSTPENFTAIRDAWKFRLPVTQVTPDEWERLKTFSHFSEVAPAYKSSEYEYEKGLKERQEAYRDICEE